MWAPIRKKKERQILPPPPPTPRIFINNVSISISVQPFYLYMGEGWKSTLEGNYFVYVCVKQTMIFLLILYIQIRINPRRKYFPGKSGNRLIIKKESPPPQHKLISYSLRFVISSIEIYSIHKIIDWQEIDCSI